MKTLEHNRLWQQVEEYLADIDMSAIPESIAITDCETAINAELFIETHLSIIENNSKNPRYFGAYLERLHTFVCAVRLRQGFDDKLKTY